MIPIRVARALAPHNPTVQNIGISLSITNYKAGMDYLEGYYHRKHIEDQVRTANVQHWEGEHWIDNEWSTHWKNPQRRKQLDKAIDKVYREIKNGTHN